MLTLLSPAKTLNFDDDHSIEIPTTLPDFIADSSQLIHELKKFSVQDIAQLMSLSDKLAALNVTRYSEWSKTFTSKNSKAALLAFNGDVYEGLDASTLTKKQKEFAQNHLRILSGLYGVLRPFDLMQAYRLEMGTQLANKKGKDLYSFWGSKVTEKIKFELDQDKKPYLLNLASDEYFKVIQPSLLGHPVISPVFQDQKDGKFKIISFYAKRARGLMARFVIEKNLNDPAKLKSFDGEGYQYVESLSSPLKPVFQRKQRA
jgi:cytoplasmic iron level regulating protein YaaA (DUF328/UPF0246 family)